MNALAQVRVGSRVVGARDATRRRARATRGTARARSAFETIGRSRARRVVASRARWTRGGDRASGGDRRAIARIRARRGADARETRRRSRADARDRWIATAGRRAGRRRRRGRGREADSGGARDARGRGRGGARGREGGARGRKGARDDEGERGDEGEARRLT